MPERKELSKMAFKLTLLLTLNIKDLQNEVKKLLSFIN